MRVVRKGNNFYIEEDKKFLWFRFKNLVRYNVKEPSFGEDYTEWIDRSYPYQFPTYRDAEKFIKRLCQL